MSLIGKWNLEIRFDGGDPAVNNVTYEYKPDGTLVTGEATWGCWTDSDVPDDVAFAWSDCADNTPNLSSMLFNGQLDGGSMSGRVIFTRKGGVPIRGLWSGTKAAE